MAEILERERLLAADAEDDSEHDTRSIVSASSEDEEQDERVESNMDAGSETSPIRARCCTENA